MSPFYLGAGLVVTSAVCFGLMPILALYAYREGMSVPTLLFLRFTLAAGVLFLYLFLKKENFSVGRHRLASLFVLGGLLYPCLSTFYFTAVRYIPASLAVLLFYVYPVIVTVFSALLEKEVIGRRLLFSMGISLFGLFLFLGASAKGAVNPLGVLYVFGAAIFYAVYIVFGNRVVKEVPPLLTTAFVILFAALSLFVAGLAGGGLNFGFGPAAWLPVAALALFSTVVSFLAFFRGLELVGSTRASVLSITEPLATVVFSALLFSERLTALQMLGGVGILAGAGLIVLAKEAAS